MRFQRKLMAALVTSGLVGSTALAQTPPAAQSAPLQTPAAVVNGQLIAEASVQRALKRVPPAQHANARPEIVDFLVDNLLVEQYLLSQKVVVEPKEIADRVAEIKAETVKRKQDFAKMLQELNLTEAELTQQVAADMRWEKFANSKATEPALKSMFDANTDMFDGSMVRARHILITPKEGDAKAATEAATTLANVKKEVIAAGATATTALPPTADPMAKEATRAKAMEDAFAAAAGKHSACPSKKEGGDLSWFPRAGSMVEPFAKAAFALKPYEISEPVPTPFGLHLILVTGRKAGQPTPFEKVKEEVKEMYCSQVRENLVKQLRGSAKVTVTPVAKQ